MSFLKSAIQQTAQAASAASMKSAQASNVKINAGSGDDLVIANGNCNQVVTESGDDTVILAGDFNDVLAESGNNTIATNGNSNNISAMNGNNDIYSIGNDNQIGAMNGNNRITSKGNDNFIAAAFGNNDIFSDGDGNEIQTSRGDQTIESHGDSNLINAGNGNHDIFSTGDENDIVFGDGSSKVVFFGTENIIKGGNGDHTVKTLDWAIQQNDADPRYAQYADLIDEYAIKTTDTTTVRDAIILEESGWTKVDKSIGTGSTKYADNRGTKSTNVEVTTADLTGMLSDEEKAAAAKVDFTETFAGGPRYVFAYGSQDKKVHLYDMKTNKSVVKLPQGNNILYTKNEKPTTLEGGAGSFVKVTKNTTSSTQTSGKYEDLAGKGEDVYAQEIIDGKITTNLITTTYDFAHLSNAISLGKGTQTVYITGSTPYTGKNTNCDCGEENTNSTFVQRDAVETNRYERIEDLNYDILYSTGLTSVTKSDGTTTVTTGDKTSYSGGSSSSNVRTGSPLIVDFNKDGKVSAAAGLGVDVDNNGTKDGAAVNGDKMLAMSDMNKNGKVDGTEVFGDQTVNPFTGKKINAKNGFEALKAVAESAYIATGIRCLNNGEVDLQALKSALSRIGINLGFISGDNTSNLEDLAHVASINVENYIQQNQSGDVQHNQLGSYKSVDGKTYKTDDVWFNLK